MAWIAALITNYQLRWRRLVIICVGVVCALGLLVDAALGTSGGLSRPHLLEGALALVMVLYLARAGFRELARMKAAPR